MTTPLAGRRLLEVPPTVSLRCVATFVEVAELGSFRKAAERLYMDASTASKLVRQLETDLGQRLLERTTRQVTLTPHGEEALVVARRLLKETRRLLRVAQRAS